MGIIICGFGMSMVLMGTAFLIWGAEHRHYPVEFGPPIFLGDIFLPRSYVWILVVAVALMAGLTFFLFRTRLGLGARVVAFSKETASLMGVNVPLMISLIFGLGCAVAAAGGVLIAPIVFAQVQMGYVVLLKAFAAAVVGGSAACRAPSSAACWSACSSRWPRPTCGPDYKDIYAFALMIAVLMIRPSGLLGTTIKVKA